MISVFVRGTFLTVGLFSLSSCLSNVRSTGAKLPQTSLQFEDSQVKVTVDHHCSGGRCDGFDANIENTGDAPVEIIPSTSKISRAGESFALELEDAGKRSLVIPAHSDVDVEFHPVNKSGTPMTYKRASEVWCSLKVDSACKSASKGEAMCAGFARYYYQSYTSAGGWLSIDLAYKDGYGKLAHVQTFPPSYLGDPPSFQLEKNDDAPSWFSSSGDVVIHRVTCDDQCRCVEEGKRRNFFTDDKFLPAEK